MATVAEPEAFPQAFCAAWAARDAAALAGLFVADADFVNVVGIWWEDRAAIEAAHGYALGSFFSRSTLVPGRVKVRRLGEAAAVVHARMRLSGQIDREGRELAARTVMLVFVLQQEAAGWRGVCAQNTDVVPGAETQAATAEGPAPADYR